MKDKKLIIFASILVLLFLIGVSIVVYKIAMWEKECKNRHYEEYMQYPCEGATHYARVHRNNDKACKRTKIICEEIK